MEKELFKKLLIKLKKVKPDNWRRSASGDYSTSLGNFRVALREVSTSECDMAGVTIYNRSYLVEVFRGKKCVDDYSDNCLSELYNEIDYKKTVLKEQREDKRWKRSLSQLERELKRV